MLWSNIYSIFSASGCSAYAKVIEMYTILFKKFIIYVLSTTYFSWYVSEGNGLALRHIDIKEHELISVYLYTLAEITLTTTFFNNPALV